MNRRKKSPFLALFVAAAVLTGCAGTTPMPYAGLPSSPHLRANANDDDADRIPYRYDTPTRWEDYQAVILDPVAVYRGPDNQFEDVTEEEKNELAKYMEAEFRKALATRFTVTSAPGPRTLRVALTLTGAKTNTAVVSTVTRFDLLGGPANVVQSIRGKEGLFIGSISYAADIRDARDNRLLKAYVAKQYPNALNVGATFGRLAAARTGADKGAEDLLAQMR
ncbi:FIG00904498: hypothetical protein [plant metagenome]|uniref:Lipoprotein n=1 Tax=plant metagenome TaxID=1297885 RepID=A0A484R4L1_9ZZZZ